ncbi:unnamed protein product, partial [Closterium sp. NIES-54]
MSTRKLNSVRKLGTPSVSQAAEAVLRGVWETTHLPTPSAGAKNVRAGTRTPRPPTPSVPLTKLLNRRGLTGALLLLALAATKASTRRSCTATSTTSSATSTTAAAASTPSATAATASTAATDSPTPCTTPTTTPPPPPPPLLPLPLLLRRRPLEADAAPTSSVPTRSTAAAEATEGRRGIGEHHSKKGTLLWHHRLGHPSLPRLRGMASRALVSGLPRSLPPLPPGPAPTCVPCVEGRQRAAPHSSPFPPTEAPVQTLHMDVWGLARVRGQGHERYFLLVVDDYSRYTTVFHLRSKAEVLETFTLPASPQQNGIAERRIGMVMDIARTSMLHAAAPHFLWPFAVQYTEHQINLQPRVSLPETTPTLRWTGKVGDASEFRVWGSRAFVRYTAANKLSSSAVPCIFLRFPPDAPGWQFCHPASRRVLSSQDVTFDESVSYYRLFPYRTASLPPPPLFLAPGTPPVDPLSPQGPAPS